MAVNFLGKISLAFCGSLTEYKQYRQGLVVSQEVYIDDHSDYQGILLVLSLNPVDPVHFILPADASMSVAGISENLIVLHPGGLRIWGAKAGIYREFPMRSAWNEFWQLGQYLIVVDIFEIYFLNTVTLEISRKDMGTNIVDIAINDLNLTVHFDDMPSTVINVAEI